MFRAGLLLIIRKYYSVHTRLYWPAVGKTLPIVSQHKRLTYTTYCIYRVVPPDDEQQACSKHVVAYYWNKLIENSAFCWFMLYGYITMHGQQNIKNDYMYIWFYECQVKIRQTEISSQFFSALQPWWALASSTIRLYWSPFLAFSIHPLIPILLRSAITSSSHLILGLPILLVTYSFPFSTLLGMAVSSILSTWPSHSILCALWTWLYLLLPWAYTAHCYILFNFIAIAIIKLS
jgi:hypothetical protein